MVLAFRKVNLIGYAVSKGVIRPDPQRVTKHLKNFHHRKILHHKEDL